MCCSAACCLMDGRLKSFHLSSDASARWPVGGRPEGARYTGCLFEVFVSVEFVRYDPCSIVTQTSERRGLLSQDSKEPIHRFLPPAMARCLACKTPDRADFRKIRPGPWQDDADPTVRGRNPCRAVEGRFTPWRRTWPRAPRAAPPRPARTRRRATGTRCGRRVACSQRGACEEAPFTREAAARGRERL